MKKVLNIMSLITLILTTGVLFHLLYLGYYPFEIVKLHSFNMKQQSVKRGEYLYYTLDFQKNYNFPAKIRYYLVDGIIVQLENGSTHRSKGSYIAPNAKLIPTTILPGKYSLRVELEYDVLPWRSIIYTWESHKFTVL